MPRKKLTAAEELIEVDAQLKNLTQRRADLEKAMHADVGELVCRSGGDSFPTSALVELIKTARQLGIDQALSRLKALPQ